MLTQQVLGMMKAFYFAGIVLAAIPVEASLMLNPVNGHYYDVVDKPISWDDANLEAASLSYLGASGHLATITSAQENLFLTNAFGGSAIDTHWLGGYQLPGSVEPNGGWTWVTGEPWGYTNWFSTTEPNNAGGNENWVQFAHPLNADGKPWNDIYRDSSSGYIVEFETSAVPEPGTLTLLGGAALFLGGCRYRSRKVKCSSLG